MFAVPNRIHWTLTVLLLFPLGSLAQKPNPKAPALTAVSLSGAQRGTQVEVTITGKNLANPTGVWTSFPATVTIPNDKNNGKNAAALRVSLNVPKDAPLGFHTLRLATNTGMSNALIFCIDDLPQVADTGKNHSKSTAQKVTLPCVVMGTVEKELNDYYQFDAKAGEQISFEILGRRLGSDLDPQLSLFDASTGRELPRAYNNDAPGLQTDARLTYTFEKAGSYLVEVRDALYRGAGTYRYRLRIGDFPCATTPYPLVAQRGSKVNVVFTGDNVDGITSMVDVPNDPTESVVWVAPKGKSGVSGWPVALHLSDLPSTVETEPNTDPKQATRIQAPGGVSGRFLKKAEKDHFVFTAKKGQKFTIEARTVDVGTETEVYFRVTDAKGKQLAVTNPAKAASVNFNCPADGDYFVIVEHLNYETGPSEAYHLEISPVAASYSLALALDRFEVQSGKPLSIPILATRAGYAGPIEVTVIGNPALSGTVTIPAGQPKKANTPGATLKVTVKAGTPPGPLSFMIQGKAMVGGQAVIHYASVNALVDATTAKLPYPPPQFLTQIGLAVLP